MPIKLTRPSADTTGATDTANIQADIATLQANYASSDVVTIVLEGEYYLDDTISITADPGVMFEGVNATVTQKTASTPCISFSGTTSGGCRGITFAADTEDDDAIEVDGCTNLVFENLDFTSFARHGVVFDGTCTGSRFDIRKQDAEWAVELLKVLTAESRTTYNHTVYSYNSTAIAAGATTYRLLGNSFWYANNGSDRSKVSCEDVADGIVGVASRESATSRVLVDVETWSPRTEPEQTLRNMRNAVWMWRAGSGRELGFYRVLPYSDYWTPAYLQRAIGGSPDYSEATQTAKVARNMEVNDRTAAALVDLVDYLCPRVYRSYNDDDHYDDWQWYVTLSVMEALRVGKGKPVYPIVWFNDANGDELSSARWIQMLQYVSALPGISGIMVYSGGSAPSGYTWTDAIAALIDGTGDVADS